MLLSPTKLAAKPSAVVRGLVPAAMRVPEATGTPDEIVKRSIRAYVRRHGVMPTEIEFGGQVFAVAGVCECGAFVLASEDGAAFNPPCCSNHVPKAKYAPALAIAN